MILKKYISFLQGTIIYILITEIGTSEPILDAENSGTPKIRNVKQQIVMLAKSKSNIAVEINQLYLEKKGTFSTCRKMECRQHIAYILKDLRITVNLGAVSLTLWFFYF